MIARRVGWQWILSGSEHASGLFSRSVLPGTRRRIPSSLLSLQHTMPTARTLHLILNGKHDSPDEVLSALRALRADGHHLQLSTTERQGDAVRFAREAAREGAETVVAAGGDGTLNEVVQGLLEATDDAAATPALGLLPLGTANDFAGAACIPEDPRQALRLVLHREPVAIDVGQLNERFFVNMATGGFGTEITAETPEELKNLLGRAAYALTGLTHLSSIEAQWGRITGPSFSWEGNLYGVAVGNGRCAGGGHLLCPNALLADGLLDLSVLPELPGDQLTATVETLLTDGAAALDESLVHARLPRLTIDVPAGLHMNLDGEPLHGTHFDLQVHPGRLPMYLPDTAPVS